MRNTGWHRCCDPADPARTRTAQHPGPAGAGGPLRPHCRCRYPARPGPRVGAAFHPRRRQQPGAEQRCRPAGPAHGDPRKTLDRGRCRGLLRRSRGRRELARFRAMDPGPGLAGAGKPQPDPGYGRRGADPEYRCLRTGSRRTAAVRDSLGFRAPGLRRLQPRRLSLRLSRQPVQAGRLASERTDGDHLGPVPAA
ncbi:hypothetical protein SDC9_166547 [bioreactor metagenome]|uniref:Uncharacterized protein n=1 Tax=bioreactor metagenome TaxID=1076179 RepID=A0A645FX88_9ZZZZ